MGLGLEKGHVKQDRGAVSLATENAAKRKGYCPLRCYMPVFDSKEKRGQPDQLPP